jgi:phage tail sheath gpL-like
VPYDPPQLELKATYGLVKPEPMTMPEASPLWNPASYAAFDTAMANARDPAQSVRTLLSLLTVNKEKHDMLNSFEKVLYIGLSINDNRYRK